MLISVRRAPSDGEAHSGTSPWRTVATDALRVASTPALPTSWPRSVAGTRAPPGKPPTAAGASADVSGCLCPVPARSQQTRNKMRFTRHAATLLGATALVVGCTRTAGAGTASAAPTVHWECQQRRQLPLNRHLRGQPVRRRGHLEPGSGRERPGRRLKGRGPQLGRVLPGGRPGHRPRRHHPGAHRPVLEPVGDRRPTGGRLPHLARLPAGQHLRRLQRLHGRVVSRPVGQRRDRASTAGRTVGDRHDAEVAGPVPTGRACGRPGPVVMPGTSRTGITSRTAGPRAGSAPRPTGRSYAAH
jgi:hypothetical protein